MKLKQQIAVAQQLMEGFEAPVLPKAALDLQKLFDQSATPSPEKITHLISLNPFLAGELVSLANIPSLTNCVGVRVKDIESAIYRLGYKRLKNYILSIYIKQLLSEYKIKGLSYHSIDIALIAANIATKLKTVSPDEAYLLGLVHDVGAFILSAKKDSYGDNFVGNQYNHYSMERDEYETFGTTHSALGYVIADSWCIPNYIAQTILLHHTPHIHVIENNKLRTLIAVLELAHSISVIQKHKNNASEESKKIYNECQQVLGLTDDDMLEICSLS